MGAGEQRETEIGGKRNRRSGRGRKRGEETDGESYERYKRIHTRIVRHTVRGERRKKRTVEGERWGDRNIFQF